MDFIAFAGTKIKGSIGLVAGALLATYGVVSDGMGLYQLGLPGWAWLTAGLLLFFGSVVALLYQTTHPQQQVKSNEKEGVVAERVTGKKFINTEVNIDGKAFVLCHFHNVTFTTSGAPAHFERCSIGPHLIKPTSKELQNYTAMLVQMGHIGSGIWGEHGMMTQEEVDRRQGTTRLSKASPSESA